MPNYPAPIATISAMTVDPLRRIAPAFTAVCALHALLVWWAFAPSLPPEAARHETPAMATRWIAAPPAVKPAMAPEPMALAPDTVARKTVRPTARHTAVVPPTTQEVPPTAPQTQATPEVAAAPAPGWPADSLQRAVRGPAPGAVRHKSYAELSNERLAPSPVDAQAALRQGMAASARTDCLRGGEGGYRGSSLGLLAAPLLLWNVAAGRCAK